MERGGRDSYEFNAENGSQENDSAPILWIAVHCHPEHNVSKQNESRAALTYFDLWAAYNGNVA